MAWLLPALKAVLPHLSDIVSAAKPIFTKSRDGDRAAPSLLEQQIAELQAVAAQNDAAVRDLAQQLQRLATAVEQSALAAEAKMKRILAWSFAAVSMSAVAIAVSLVSLFLR